MASNNENRKEIVRKYISENLKLGNRTIARNLYAKYPEWWKNIEGVRSMVRSHTGKMGKKSRRTFKVGVINKPSFQMPKSLSEKREDFILPKSITKLGVLSDVHIPFHDEVALQLAVNELKKEKIDGLLLNGDFADFFSVSFHEKDPRKRLELFEEIESVVEGLRWLRNEFAGVPIYYKIGNHEDRLRRYLMVKAEEILHDPEYNIENKFKFGELGIQLVDSLQRIRAGKLLIFHGHEMRGSGGVNPARWLSLKTKVSSMCGHFHRKSAHEWRDSNDNVFACYSLPCLCELTPDYLPENDWSHGFGFINLESNGDFKVTLKSIINGKVY